MTFSCCQNLDFGTMTTYKLQETDTRYYTDDEGPLSTYKKVEPPLLDPVRPNTQCPSQIPDGHLSTGENPCTLGLGENPRKEGTDSKP